MPAHKQHASLEWAESNGLLRDPGELEPRPSKDGALPWQIDLAMEADDRILLSIAKKLHRAYAVIKSLKAEVRKMRQRDSKQSRKLSKQKDELDTLTYHNAGLHKTIDRLESECEQEREWRKERQAALNQALIASQGLNTSQGLRKQGWVGGPNYLFLPSAVQARPLGAGIEFGPDEFWLEYEMGNHTVCARINEQVMEIPMHHLLSDVRTRH